MNYRHAYHAGNFADVMKHALLARIILHLGRKPTPFRVIDTHAGIGLYDLSGEAAQKTGEWHGGIAKLAAPLAPEAEALLEPYRAAVAATRARFGESAYPGTPQLWRELLRKEDRAVVVEAHPRDAETLAERYRGAPAIKVMHLDGWTALHALIPPKERRGLVVIDPPFEAVGEHERLAEEMLRAAQKWPTGIFAGWYPIKSRREPDDAARRLDRNLARPALRLELFVDTLDEASRLNGCGLFVINPPYTLADEADVLLAALAKRLARRAGGHRVEPLGPRA